MKNNKFKASLLIMVSLFVACSKENPTNVESKHNHVNIADIREETKNINKLPKFLLGKPEGMQEIYKNAAIHKDLLEKIPCYCGCGEEVGHVSSYDCFVHENKKDGSLVWDDHGTKCGVCVEIAEKSILNLNEGMSVKEIREAINNDYQNGYAKPTPTPEI